MTKAVKNVSSVLHWARVWSPGLVFQQPRIQLLVTKAGSCNWKCVFVAFRSRTIPFLSGSTTILCGTLVHHIEKAGEAKVHRGSVKQALKRGHLFIDANILNSRWLYSTDYVVTIYRVPLLAAYIVQKKKLPLFMTHSIVSKYIRVMEYM